LPPGGDLTDLYGVLERDDTALRDAVLALPIVEISSLDVVGEERSLGKTIGGDIMQGKKTYLLLKAVERAKGKDRTVLASLMNNTSSGGESPRQKVKAVTDIYKRYGVIEAARQEIKRDTREATDSLVGLPKNNATSMLHWFSDLLVKRVF
ncbi:MAG: polyprenyl synthetase family protein, partial [Ignavibacteria bacterium]|nr:polyprenyl synthetase family protein [Ignavibacteria bacterium]